MKISVKEVKNLNSKLQNKYESYENNYLGYYNYLNQTKNDWYDTNSNKYFQTIEEDKKNDYNTLQEIKNLSKVFDYLIANYGELGNEIEYDKTQKDQIISIVDDIISLTNKVLNSYNSIGIYNYSERSILYSQKNTVMNLKTKAKELKRQLNNKMNKIDKIEEMSKNKFSKISIEPIREKDITPFI